MGRTQTNLFIGLHKWACDRRQDENFTTEAFAHLLGHLLGQPKDHDFAARLLTCLARPGFRVAVADCDHLRVSSQMRFGGAQPDIHIEKKGEINIFVEVKVEATVDLKQLRRHRKELDGGHAPHRSLVLLTKTSLGPRPDIENLVDRRMGWWEIAEVLRGATDLEPIGGYLVKQFVGFLKERKMAMEKVHEKLPKSLESFESLMGMLKDVIKALGHYIGSGDPIENSGFFFGQKAKSKHWTWYRYWCGIDVKDPNTVCFWAYDALGTTAMDAAKKAGWERVDRDLVGEDVDVCAKYLPLERDFFKQNVEGQHAFLKKFVRDSHGYIEALRKPPRHKRRQRRGGGAAR